MGGVELIVANSTVNPPSPGRGSDVFVAAVPLRATKGPPQLVMSTAYSLHLSWDLQHFMVLSTSTHLPSQVLVFDFQPQDPESIYAALAALSGSKIPGVVQTRTMKKLPKTRCWRVGSCNVDVEDAIHKFNSNWDTDLIVGQNDCRHYTNGLVECLTGEKHVLDRLRRSQKSIIASAAFKYILLGMKFSVSTVDDFNYEMDGTKSIYSLRIGANYFLVTNVEWCWDNHGTLKLLYVVSSFSLYIISGIPFIFTLLIPWLFDNQLDNAAQA